MKKIIEISKEILNIYKTLESNLSNKDKNILITKLMDLIKKENELYNDLDVINNYNEYIELLGDCDIDIQSRINHYLTYLNALNKGIYSPLIHYENTDKKFKYYRYFDLEKELNKIIITKVTDRYLYSQLYMDKLLEEEYFNNHCNFIELDMKQKLNKEEYELYKDSKYIYVKDQLNFFVQDINENYLLIKGLLEFDIDNYGKHYNDIINYLNTLKDKNNLELFINKFNNRNKINK